MCTLILQQLLIYNYLLTLHYIYNLTITIFNKEVK